jgi:hypothetical protein
LNFFQGHNSETTRGVLTCVQNLFGEQASPGSNRALVFQSTGKKKPIESYKIKILNKKSKIFANKCFFTVIVLKCLKMPSLHPFNHCKISVMHFSQFLTKHC